MNVALILLVLFRQLTNARAVNLRDLEGLGPPFPPNRRLWRTARHSFAILLVGSGTRDGLVFPQGGSGPVGVTDGGHPWQERAVSAEWHY